MGAKFYSETDTRGQPAFLTPYTATHVVAGLAMYSLFSFLPPVWSALAALGLHTAYEIKDLSLFYTNQPPFPERLFGEKPPETEDDVPNTPLNSLGDTLGAAVGYAIGALTGLRVSPLVALVGLIVIYLLRVTVVDVYSRQLGFG